MGRKNEVAEIIDKVIGRKVQELRIAKGLSRQKLAARIGVTHQQLQKYEKGVNRICAGRLFAIAKALHAEVQYFFDAAETFKPTLNKHERLAIELSKVFMNIHNHKQQESLVILARSLQEVV